MDAIDIAQRNEETIQKAALDSTLNASKFKQLSHTGKCHYCEEPLKQGLFCNIDCSSDYEWLKKCESKRG